MSQREQLQGIVSEILAMRREKGGVKQIYFVGCGGSLGALYPAANFMQRESMTIKSGWINSNEFVHSTPKDFGENSLLVVACHRGNTPETIAATKLGREKGAAVIVLTWLEESEILSYTEYPVFYTFGANKDIAGEKTMCALYIAVELLKQTEGYEHYDRFMEGADRIDGIVKRACAHVEKRAHAFAKEYRDDKLIYTMGSGAGYASAYMECICIFMEMQWIHSSCIHTGEYFHGPFEVTDAETPFLIQISEGTTRALDERALKFLKTYAKRIEVLDAKELGLSTIDSSVVDYFNHSLFNNVYPVYNEALAAERQHPLSTRRYMWRVEY
ncbi:MAG: SIS domain-containing protein [Clostridiales bacterium]|nr:SIS domain-containing protein [Clostridiales bacterium]